MAKVKIIAEKGEDILDVELGLFKALNHQLSGEVHEGESFLDPAMTDLAVKLEQDHSIIYQEMMAEINETLEKDYIK